MRYLEWSWDPDPDDSTCTTDYTYVLRESDGSIKVVHDRHIEGMFPRDMWLRLFRQAGFEPRVIPFDHSELEPGYLRALRMRQAWLILALCAVACKQAATGRRPRRHRRARRFAC